MPIDDRQLETLLAMAAEAEAMERAAVVGRMGPAARARGWFVGVAGLAAMAAGVGAAWMIWPAATVVPAPVRVAEGTHDHERGRGTSATMLVAEGTHDHEERGRGTGATMLLAVFRDQHGGCRCVLKRDLDVAAGRMLTEDELVALALLDACTTSADSVLVIGLRGPEADLPRTSEEAEAIAACVASKPEFRRESSVATGGACVPPTVSVVATLLSLSR